MDIKLTGNHNLDNIIITNQNKTHMKTKQMLVYIIKNSPKSYLTSLMKLSYLADLISVKRHGHQISDFEYIRYYYGPFDNKIYTVLSDLVYEGTVLGEPIYSHDGDENLLYFFNENKEDYNFEELSEADKVIIDEVLEQLKGYGVKTLTEVAYKTAPMKKLGATLGGNEALGNKLDLNCD